jgi:putative inorganic carbon (hco3(-)) transporter
MGFILGLLYILLTYITPVALGVAADNLMGVLLVLALFGSFLTMLATRFSFREPEIYLVPALIGCAAMSRIAAGWFGGAIFGVENVGRTCGLFFVICVTASSFARVRIVGRLMVLIGLYYVIVGHLAYHYGVGGSSYLLQQNLDELESGVASIPRIRGLGFLNDPNDLGQFFVVCIGLLGLNWKRQSPLRNFVFVLVPAAILLDGIYLTHSRGALLALVVLGFFVMKPRLGKFALPVGCALAGGMLLAMRLLAGRGVAMHESSAAGRFEAWSAALQMFRSSPVFGVGFQAFTDHHELTAHNSFALVLAELGFVGAFIWLAIIVCALMKLNSMITDSDAPLSRELTACALSIRAAMAGFLAAAWLLSRAYTVTNFILVALVVALMESARRARMPEASVRPRRHWATVTLAAQVVLIAALYASVRFFWS